MAGGMQAPKAAPWHTQKGPPRTSPVDPHLLQRMQWRASVAALAFMAACGVAGVAAVYLLSGIAQMTKVGLQGLPLLVLAPWIATEVVFLFMWRAKYRRLSRQQQVPTDPDFDPHYALNYFLEGKPGMSKWIDVRDMLSAWFGGVSAESIPLSNVAELIAYGFFYRTRQDYAATYGQPAEVLAEQLERAWGLQFPRGYDPHLGFMAHLWQPIRCHYRPALFYLGIEWCFALKHVVMLAMGFTHFTARGFDCYVRHPTPGASLTPYSSRDGSLASLSPDTSGETSSGDDVSSDSQGTASTAGGEVSKTPVVFLHGVGLGLLPYALFVARVAATGHPVAALEVPHLGMRWSEVADAERVTSAVAAMIREGLGWRHACVAAHSYGTFHTSRLVQRHKELVHSVVLLDPVCHNMFTGKLIYNFVYAPLAWTTWFIARDLHHASSVCRDFLWSRLNLWPDALPARSLVVLSDGDELVPVKETVLMLQHAAPHAVVLHHPTHCHADFIRDFQWQDRVVQAMVNLLDTGVCAPTPAIVLPVAEPGLPPTADTAQEGSAEEQGSRLEQPARTPVRRRRRASVGQGLGVVAERAPESGQGLGQSGASPGGGVRPPADTGQQQASAGAQGDETDQGRATPAREATAHHKGEGNGVNRDQQSPFKSPSQTHDRSDSASSYDVILSRLRPKPHRAIALATRIRE